MLWGNWSSSEGSVKWWDVKEEGDESKLEEETEVTHSVDHTLLVKGQVSSLGGDKTGSLDSNDGYEISGLSVFEGFGGVADWPVLRNVGCGSHEGFVSSESARCPGFTSLEWAWVEKSDINLGVSLMVPSKSSDLGELNNIAGLINWSLIII